MNQLRNSSRRAKRAQRLLEAVDQLVDRQHHEDEAATPAITLLHGSKFPPSPSGIGLYAEVFETALQPAIRIVRLSFHPYPVVTQQLRRSMSGFMRGLRGCGDVDLVHVELGGRSLAEFYFILGLLRRRRRPWLVVTCHDIPSVVGAPMLFTAFDRRGLRRFGIWASSTVGRALERRVVRECDTVFTLTRSGAQAMAEHHHRVVRFLGHVVSEVDVPEFKASLIYLPGYVSDECRIAEISRIAHQAPLTEQGSWRVIVGAANPAHVADEMEALDPAQRASVEFQGSVGEPELLATFRESAVVLRVGSGHNASNCHAASGPLAMAISHGCTVLTDDPRPGVQELHDEGLIHMTTCPLDALQALLGAAAGSTLVPRSPSKAVDLYGQEATRSRYLSSLQEDASAAIASAGAIL